MFSLLPRVASDATPKLVVVVTYFGFIFIFLLRDRLFFARVTGAVVVGHL